MGGGVATLATDVKVVDVVEIGGVVVAETVGAPCAADALVLFNPRPLFFPKVGGARTGDVIGESGGGLFTTDLGNFTGESSVMKLTSPT